MLAVAKLCDPIGQIIDDWDNENGLHIGKMRVPLGVIAIIFEARPNVSVDAAVLCLKTSNAVILRGGKEAINSNKILCEIMRGALSGLGYNPDFIQLVEDTSRESSVGLMKLNGYVDVLIPRGGANLISAVVKNATVPVIETGTGNCHIYVDSKCDIDRAVEILYNAKTSRPSVCNSCESLLVHSDIADKFLPLAYSRLKEKNVVFKGCETSRAILNGIEKVTDEDYYTEFLDYILSVRVVDSLDQAIAHINKYGTKHSDAIITDIEENKNRFFALVDSAAVYANASTRFTDGFVFGFGAEIGISTQKMHARGPMGLNELTSIKYIISGNGQIR